MVCIPCIVIPALLFIWHKWIQPFVLKIWNPFGTEKPLTYWEKRAGKLNKDLINDVTETWLRPDKLETKTENGNATSGMKCPFAPADSSKIPADHSKID